MTFGVSEAERGTSEATWLQCSELVNCLPFALPRGRIVVLAPHPDDEVLGVGGVIASVDAPVRIVAVTDGEASHPGRPGLADRRAAERTLALARLGVLAEVVRLGIADGGVARCADLAERIAPLVADAALVLAPWPRDGHPDHDAVGAAASGAAVAFYPVWAWHWARPSELPWHRARRFELSPAVHARKIDAIGAYASQLGDILPPFVVARFMRPFEVLFV